MDELDVLPFGPDPGRVNLAAPMRFIVFAPKYNTRGRHDATGAFIPEAQRFLRHHGLDSGDVHLIDNQKSKRAQRVEVLRIINSWALAGGPVCVAFFCHGLRNGIQLGFRSGHIGKLAKSIAAIRDRSVRVALYSCDCGRDWDRERRDDLQEHGGDGGFADLLRDALCEAGCVDCQVDAHTTAGHASRNPHVRRFLGLGSPVGHLGGFYIVPRHHPLWRKWRKALRTPFRFDYPTLPVGAIHALLADPT